MMRWQYSMSTSSPVICRVCEGCDLLRVWVVVLISFRSSKFSNKEGSFALICLWRDFCVSRGRGGGGEEAITCLVDF